MTKAKVFQIIKALQKENVVYGPRKIRGELRYAKILKPSQVDLSGQIPLNSFKDFLFPAEHTLFSFDGRGPKEILYNSPPMVFFGLTIFDLRALDFLDQVFEKDPYFQARRRNLIVCGLSYTPVKEDMADQFYKDYEENILEHLQFDIFFNETRKNNFRLMTGTRRGQRILEAVGIKDYDHVQFAGLIREEGIDPNAKLNRERVVKSYGQPIWQKWGDMCLACGKCTIACPTCYCFDLIDESNLDGKSGRKKRVWGSCFYSEFAEIAGGINFLKTKADHINNWYQHKHVRDFDALAISGCIGCGRCDRVCPAGIKRLEVLGSLDTNKPNSTDHQGEKHKAQNPKS